MHSKQPKPVAGNRRRGNTVKRSGQTDPGDRFAMTKSMHQGVEIWCDCCSCEAEPYWVEAMRELDKSNPDGTP